MVIEEIFATQIHVVDFNVDLEEVKRLCVEHSKNVESTHRSNLFGYQSPSDLFEREEFRPLMDEITASVNGVMMRSLTELNAWVNINKKNGMNKKHTHPGCYRSAVLYVSNAHSPIRFFDPRPAAVHVEDSPVFSFTPTKGQLLIFPAWLEHDVEPNMEENKTRITIACNYGI